VDSMTKFHGFDDLKHFLISKSGLRMQHIYKPVMLLEIINAGGKASKEQIAKAFLFRDSSQIDYYRRKVIHPMPGTRLVRDGLLEKHGEIYMLTGLMASLSSQQRSEVEQILEQRIEDYLQMRNPFGDNNMDAVPGSIRYEVLKKAGSRCELCGVSSKDKQIDVDHIEPRSKGGSNDISNLQALCRTCNAQKRDRDNTNFDEMHESYNHRELSCVFCAEQDQAIECNNLGYMRVDKYPVTAGHTLIIPKRHVADYFELYPAERNALEKLLHRQRKRLKQDDETVTGFNIGINVGESAGQTIYHVHIHLIPRRKGDVENPRGGVRHVIPDKGYYST